LATGAVGGHVKRWIDACGLEQVSFFSLPLWGLAHKTIQLEEARQFDAVITIEDHLLDAGFGSWLSEALRNRREIVPRVFSIGLDASVCGLVGSQETLNKLGGLSAERFTVELNCVLESVYTI
jgi:transketolase